MVRPQKHIKKMLTIYEDLFGEKPKEYTSPMEKGDHPEVDVTPELDSEGITIYQSLIGCLQWLVTNGRFDVAQAVMVLSRFRAAPREGHLARVKRVFGYTRKFPHAVIHVRTGIPDYSDLPTQTHDWMYSVKGPVKEELPHDMPKPLGKPVFTTTYEDANLYHCMMLGRSATAVLHLVNQTPIDWFSKRQATVETATYGSEFIAARIATEQIIDLRYTLRMLGAPIQSPAYMFGDNQSVITNSTLPHSTLSKRHNALSYTVCVMPLLQDSFVSITLLEQTIRLISSPKPWVFSNFGHSSSHFFCGGETLPQAFLAKGSDRIWS